MTKSFRVNARFDGPVAQKIARIHKATGKSTTAILKEGIENLPEPTQQQTLAERCRDFIGCFSGDPSLSKNYKQEVAKIIDAKYPRHR